MLSMDYERSHADLADLAVSDDGLAFAAREHGDLLTALCPEAVETLSRAAAVTRIVGWAPTLCPRCSRTWPEEDIRSSLPGPAPEPAIFALLAYERHGVALSGTTPGERREALTDLLSRAESVLDRIRDTPALKPLCVVIRAAMVRWAIDHRAVVEVDGLACALRVDPPSLGNAIRNGYLAARGGWIDCAEALRWLDGAGGYQRSTWQRPDDPSGGPRTRRSLVADATLAHRGSNGEAAGKA